MRLRRSCRSWLTTPREGLLRQRFRSVQQIYEGCRDQDRGGVSRKPRNRSKGAPYGAPFPLMGGLQSKDGSFGETKPFSDIGNHFLFCSALGLFGCNYRLDSFSKRGSLHIT
jgi:hypothetical protein